MVAIAVIDVKRRVVIQAKKRGKSFVDLIVFVV